MAYVYYSCDWITQWDKVDIDLVFDKLVEHECEISLLLGHRDKRGNELLRIGVKAPSEVKFQKIAQEVGRRYGVTDWNSLTEQEFIVGKSLNGSEENRKHVHEEIQAILRYNATNYDLHLRLGGEENLQIYTTDWLIERRSNPSVYDLFAKAGLMEFPLAYAFTEDTQGFLYMRFFAFVKSSATISDLVNSVAGKMGLNQWKRIGKDELPNILRFDPHKVGDGYSMSQWGEHLGELANYNKRLAEKNSSAT